jgi:hypothetical protein
MSRRWTPRRRGSSRRSGNDGGQIVPLAAALVGLCCVALLALVPVARTVDDRARARTAADAAALAGAADGERTAREVAVANGADLLEIDRNGDEVVVQVPVARRVLRAGAGRAWRPPCWPRWRAPTGSSVARSRWCRVCGPGPSRKHSGSAGRRTPTPWRGRAHPITSAGWPSTCRGPTLRICVAWHVRPACASRCQPPIRSTSSSVAYERAVRSEYHEKDLVGLLGRGDGRAVDSPRCR